MNGARLYCAVLSIGVAASAAAEVPYEELITHDHHLVDADFIGVVHVASVFAGEGRYFDTRLEVRDVWFTRWPTQAGASLQYATSGRVQPLEEGADMVVLLTGGEYVDSPYTFGRQSWFTILPDGLVECGSETTLFAVLPDGFLCTVQLHVDGPPMTVDEMRADVVRARARAASRLDWLDRELVANPRPLARAARGVSLDDGGATR